jgi:hypothetical protein
MAPNKILPAALLAMIFAGCDGPQRSFGYLTSPSTPPSAGTPPAPSPPNAPPPNAPPVGPTPPGGGPTYTPGVGTTAVASGDTVDSIVAVTDPACFYNWDATGRCKVFEITPSVDGVLTAEVRLSSPPAYDNLDLFLVDLSRAYVTAYTGINAELASLPVTAGSSYGIAVMAYAPDLPAPFQLSVEVVRP